MLGLLARETLLGNFMKLPIAGISCTVSEPLPQSSFEQSRVPRDIPNTDEGNVGPHLHWTHDVSLFSFPFCITHCLVHAVWTVLLILMSFGVDHITLASGRSWWQNFTEKELFGLNSCPIDDAMRLAASHFVVQPQVVRIYRQKSVLFSFGTWTILLEAACKRSIVSGTDDSIELFLLFAENHLGWKRCYGSPNKETKGWLAKPTNSPVPRSNSRAYPAPRDISVSEREVSVKTQKYCLTTKLKVFKRLKSCNTLAPIRPGYSLPVRREGAGWLTLVLACFMFRGSESHTPRLLVSLKLCEKQMHLRPSERQRTNKWILFDLKQRTVLADGILFWISKKKF